jgi:hypothetical protein
VLSCLATIYPPSADAIPIGVQNGIELKRIVAAVLDPARNFEQLTLAISYPWKLIGLDGPGDVILSLIIFGSILGLIRLPGALLAALAALIGFSLFFTLVYPGYYRHQALWLVFLLTMYWMAGESGVGSERPQSKPIVWTSAAGFALMVLLVGAQAAGGCRAIIELASDRFPQSRSRDFGNLIKDRPDLKNAIIMADPDYLLEALPYYIDNPIYLMRQRQFGNVVTFTNEALLKLDLDDILNVAKRLHQERGEPVVILMERRLSADQPATVYPEGYNWTLNVTPDQVRRFLASTKLLVRFGPAKLGETFDVYLLDRP